MAVDLRSPLYILGALLAVFSFSMLVPALADWIDGGPDAAMFFICFIVTLFAGVTLLAAFRPREKVSVTVNQAFVLTPLAWLVLTLFAALPFAVSSIHVSYTDAFFEAMSGVTTTGSTVLVGLDRMPSGILWWRSLLNWLGGVGFIVMAVAILPFLSIGGMQLFRTESSDRTEKILPRVSQVSLAIIVFYLLLSAVSMVALWLSGLTLFEAVHHTMSAVATGGFSTHDASIGGLNNKAAEYVLAAVMFLGGATFFLFINAWRIRSAGFLRDSQLQVYFLLVAVCTLLLMGWRLGSGDFELEQTFRESLFSVVSIVTTTGFATADYTTWGDFPIVLMFFLTFAGGCTGSTAGGVKIFRYQILCQMALAQLRRLTHPHAVLVPRYNGREVSREVINSVAGFVFLYFFCFALLAVGLGLFGLDLDTALSGAATALGNVGPGIGDTIGPAGNFKPLPDGAKWLLAFGMLLGRLELLTLLVLLTPGFWRS
ncbi:MAG: TrkH family potassium uptake protein [Reyranellaceae bacterium]